MAWISAIRSEKIKSAILKELEKIQMLLYYLVFLKWLSALMG
jgi:hypothetical protein